ncbi:cupin domain-containing protein [Streptomyces sp. NPDC058108]|uniref:cupin domain-containing protein n=1 Tax=Streptomyces sp. NPDC058108 TaxID=3346344 RepID=UPI0036E3D750
MDNAGEADGFHPDLPGADMRARPGLRHVRAGELDSGTAQSGGGMRRFAAISGELAGSRRIWMGETRVAPGTASSAHHHGESETAIYVVSGHPEFAYVDDSEGEPHEKRAKAGPGDYIYVPPYVAHREENPDPDEEAVVVIARSTQEPVVVNLPSLFHDDDSGSVT